MPNRIIKESITTSEKLASLSDFEFRLWIGLITQADDAGRGDARPAVIKGRVFPFRGRLTVKDVGSSLRASATANRNIPNPQRTVCGKLRQIAAKRGRARL